MTRDISKVSREALEGLAENVLDVALSLEPHMGRRLLGAIHTVRTHAQVKTRAEYDREIGDWLRTHLKPEHGGVVFLDGKQHDSIADLIRASRNAPEDE